MPIRLRLPALERLLEVPLSAIDETALRRLSGVEEDGQLEFKEVRQTFLGDDKDRSELAKDVCAMANARGGLIIFGIGDESGRAGALLPFKPPTGEIRLRIAQILRSHTRPTPPFDVAVVNSVEKHGLIFVVLAIPRSADAPHARLRTDARDGSDHRETWFQFPVRFEAGIDYLSESELASRYEGRQRGLVQRQARLRDLLNSANPDRLANPACFQLSVGAVPVNAGDFSITNDAIHEWRGRIADMGRGDRSFGSNAQLAVERHLIRQGSVRMVAHDGTIEMHSDGSLAAGYSWLAPEAKLLERHFQQPAAIQDYFLLTRLTTLASIAGAFAAEGAACSGDLLIAVRLTSLTETSRPRAMSLVGSAGQNETDFIPFVNDELACEVQLETQSSIDLLAGPVDTALTTEYHRLGTAVMQGLGLAECALTTRDGHVRPDSWPIGRQPELRQWATRHAIPID